MLTSSFIPLEKQDCKGRLAPCRGCRGVPCFISSPLAPPAAARKRRNKSFAGTPRTPAGTLRSLHPRFCEFLKQKFGMTHVCFLHLLLRDFASIRRNSYVCHHSQRFTSHDIFPAQPPCESHAFTA